jgi:hypothetical protein
VAFGEAARPAFVAYEHQVLANAQMLAQTLQAEGLRIVSGGTDNHLMLVDLSVLGSDAHGNESAGKLVEQAFDRASVHCNRNTDPLRQKTGAGDQRHSSGSQQPPPVALARPSLPKSAAGSLPSPKSPPTQSCNERYRLGSVSCWPLFLSCLSNNSLCRGSPLHSRTRPKERRPMKTTVSAPARAVGRTHEQTGWYFS